MSLTKLQILSNKNNLISGLFEIQPQIHNDQRGFFYEAYNQKEFERLGLNMHFVQDNVSFSKKNVLRGMHFQKNFSQGKLIQCLEGSIFDVVTDIRKNSPTFGEYASLIISSENRNAFYIPEGFAHGFLVLSDSALISYKCTNYYHPEDESGLMWNDPTIGIKWPVENESHLILNEKDTKYPSFIDSLFP